jgi:hypothetical protein
MFDNHHQNSRVRICQSSKPITWLSKRITGIKAISEIPAGKWFKRFDGFILCGEGEFPKTFLLPHQCPFGVEVQ